ncbi:MAG: type IV pilus modification PilV family protein [Acidimicrobiales bacterium]
MRNLMRRHGAPVERQGSTSSRWIATVFARRTGDETGFSLTEVVIAISLLGIIFVAIEWAAIGSTTASVISVQRATATSLAAKAIARAEALPFVDLQAGLNSSQLQAVLACSSWPEVTSSGGTYTLQLPGTAPIAVLAANTATSGEAPLVPLNCPPVQQVGGVSYSVAVFPSQVSGNSSLVTVTAIVSWSAPPIRNRATAVEQVEVGAQ